MVSVCLHTLWGLRSDFIGGTERFLIELAKELNVLGFNAFVVASNLQRQIDVEGVRVLGRVPDKFQQAFVKNDPNIAEFMRKEVYSRPASPSAFRQISEYVSTQLDNVTADLFHLNAFSAAIFTEVSGPLVVTNHENEAELDGFWETGSFGVMSKIVCDNRNILSPPARLFTPSSHYAELYTYQFDRNVAAIPLGINLPNFRISSPEKLPDRSARILMPSRFYPAQKGQDLALEACIILNESGYEDFVFTFSGVRDYYRPLVEDFLREAEHRGVRDQIRIKKYHDIRHAFEECDIVISPERYCSYGLSVSEALGLGIPTVLSDIPTYLEIAAVYPHAFFMREGDAESLAQSILEALEYKGIKRKNAIKFRMQNDFRNCARKYAEVYTELLGV